jgi:hypothetical protein
MPDWFNAFRFTFFFFSFFKMGGCVMGTFPRTEADILILANDVKAGLTAHVDIYPEPPVAATTLTTALTALQSMNDRVTAARAASEAATAEKVTMLETVVEMLKKDLRYAENTVGNDDVKLKYLGWSARKAPTPVTAPGQTRQLRVTDQGEGTLTLAWLAPAEGGKVTNYTVQRRLKTEIAWTEIAATYDRTISLTGQTRGVELEYSVVATNKAGSGTASNGIVVVL